MSLQSVEVRYEGVPGEEPTAWNAIFRGTTIYGIPFIETLIAPEGSIPDLLVAIAAVLDTNKVLWGVPELVV